VIEAIRAVNIMKFLNPVSAVLVGLATTVLSGQTLLISGKRPSRMTESVGPQVTLLSVPSFPGAHALWGSTGQDSRGRIWFGVTTEGIPVPSAHLFEYDPETGRIVDRGNVIDQLKAAGVLRPGEHQAKIHSRIIQGPNNYVYFASMDEEGESSHGSRGPTWGGHLWRLNLDTYRWEHLLAAPEALIAVAGGDRFVYALGYFGHVLYRFDTNSGKTEHVAVGSVDGHVSRNFVADYRGHAYVPRLREGSSGPDKRVVQVSIVEFGSDLREIKSTPIDVDHYLHAGDPTGSHGIVALQEMTDGSWFFTTHVGFLFHIVPPAREAGRAADDAPADVVRVSWFHPNGRTYPASLFTSDGTKTLLGLAHDNLADGATGLYQWLTCDVVATSCRVAPFIVAGIDQAIISHSVLYGSATRDAAGNHYVVGMGPLSGSNGPIILRVEPRKR
jgi:hypothetical protein